MQSDTRIKARFTFLTLAGLALAGVLSACGGGSDGVDRIKNDDSAVILPSVNPFNKYIGTFSENECWDISLRPGLAADMRFEMVLSASDKPDTINFAGTYFFYEYGSGKKCAVEIGSSTAFGEMTYFGTLPSVEFTNSTKPPVEADKYQLNVSNVINKGEVGFGVDELTDWKSLKGLLAQEGNILYNGDDPLDAEGFPTKLNSETFSVRQ